MQPRARSGWRRWPLAIGPAIVMFAREEVITRPLSSFTFSAGGSLMNLLMTMLTFRIVSIKMVN